MKENRQVELKALRQEIDLAFSTSESARTIEVAQTEFESAYRPDKFRSLNRDLYNSEPNDFLDQIPFALRAYLNCYGEDLRADAHLNAFLLTFDKLANQDDDFIKNRYLTLYATFDDEQRNCVCSFLSFLSKYELDEGHVDAQMLDFWCGPRNSTK